MNNDRNSVLIYEKQETIWNAITNDEIISKWNIPKLQVGEKAIFVLMPSAHNNLKENESLPMSFTIQEIIPYERFSYSSDSDKLVYTFEIFPESEGTRVSINMDGYELSLANLKACLEGKELPYT
ncbi:SRPBCC domain-containing protein [Peribacillus frigoritolerans]|uniref:SRPBCC domain-containing protein n=1 Tax=Peribacillus frigoritolerans TaxID=450367 RepID=UPI003F7EF7BF